MSNSSLTMAILREVGSRPMPKQNRIVWIVGKKKMKKNMLRINLKSIIIHSTRTQITDVLLNIAYGMFDTFTNERACVAERRNCLFGIASTFESRLTFAIILANWGNDSTIFQLERV